MHLHIANILLKTLENPQRMLLENGIGSQLALDAIEIEADALAKALGPAAVDGLAVNFLKGCGRLPTDGLYDGSAIKSEIGIASEHIDRIGHIIIARMGGNPWDSSILLDEMATRLNRLHYGQMAMDATLRSALAHPAAPAMELLQTAGIAKDTRRLDSNPLHWAVNSNNPNLARIWFEFGLDPNTRDRADNTAMARALSAEMVSTLLDAGASLDNVDADGNWAADHWKDRGLSDNARTQMMSKTMDYLLEGNGHIDRARARSMVMNLPAVRKMQAAMDRSGVGWWDGEPGESVGHALCSQVLMAHDNVTGGARKRMQSLLAVAGNSPGAQDADNPSLLRLAGARLAVESGGVPPNHIIQDAAPIPRVLGAVLEEALKEMPRGIGTLKLMSKLVAGTHQLLADGLPIERSWLQPLSREAAKCIEIGASSDAAKDLLPWLVDGWENLDNVSQEDLLPLLVPLIFYSAAHNSWKKGCEPRLFDVVMATPCHYQDRPEKKEELSLHVEALRNFAGGVGDIILKEKLKGVLCSLDAKVMQASCALATPAGTRAGPRF